MFLPRIRERLEVGRDKIQSTIEPSNALGKLLPWVRWRHMMKIRLIVLTSLCWLLALLVWPRVGGWVTPAAQIERVSPFDDATLAEPKNWVEEAVPHLRAQIGRLRTLADSVHGLRDRVPPPLRSKYAEQMESVAVHLENADTWTRSLQQEPLNPVFLAGASETLHQARKILIPWAGLLADRDGELRDFLESEVLGPEGNDDPLLMLTVALGEVAVARQAQVKQLREMLHP